MHSLRNKYLIIIAIIIIFFGVGGYLEYTHPWRKTPTLQKIDLSHFSNIKPTQVPEKMTQIPSMNITFMYPGNIKLTQINSQLISLSDPSKKADDTNTLYIYSATVPENTINFKIPFTVPGKLKHTNSMQLQEFTASQAVYSDGTNEADFLILRKKQQTVVIRIPKNSDAVGQAITDIVNSIKTLQ